MLETVLRRRGYTTLHAPDGSVAVKLAEERRFDLILMVRAELGMELDMILISIRDEISVVVARCMQDLMLSQLLGASCDA
jgi:DNA-binding response OmpR family regulator